MTPPTADNTSPSFPIARVALDIPLNTLFDFLAPTLTPAAIGRLVIVPFGNKERVGVILDIRAETDIPLAKLKPILHLQDNLPAFRANDLALFEFCASYYQHPLGQVIHSTLPPHLRKPVAAKTSRQYLSITPAGRDAIATLRPNAHAQRLILQALAAQSPQTLESLKTLHASAGSVIATLLGKHWLTIASRPSTAAHFIPGPVLNDEQQQAINTINSQHGHFAPFLLEGITGSGKTEVYLNLIAETLRQGKQAL
ncbi:MAG: DEAD/DEAH box helicase family protein, partial [Betaproteobacteria bacterium]|nr:DEAD/DEAH box helicase family protein [Betaproteobacteria bacterium]